MIICGVTQSGGDVVVWRSQAESVARPQIPSRIIIMPCKPLLSLLALSFGFLGVVVCLAGIAAVWSIGSRLDRTNDDVFYMVDKSLATVRDRVLGAQQRVQESKIDTCFIKKSTHKFGIGNGAGPDQYRPPLPM